MLLCGGGNTGTHTGNTMDWLKSTILVKILKKMKTMKLRSRSALTTSDTEIFTKDIKTKTHPEGIYDVIDDFVSSYYLHKKGELNHQNVSTASLNTSLPPTLPRKKSWANPPARPPAHPCTVKCYCITSLWNIIWPSVCFNLSPSNHINSIKVLKH